MKTRSIITIIAIIVISGTVLGVFIEKMNENQQQPIMTNFGPLSQVTTVVIPQGAEDPSSGKNYDPQYIRVIIGVNNTVRWINDGNTLNSVVADNSSDPNFYDVTNKFLAVMENAKMPNFLKPGESFEYTFTKPGYFGYHGVPHPWQRGWVLVLTSDQSDKQIPKHVDLSARDLHDTYAVGQKIDFTIELSGYGVTCPIPDIVIQKQDGNIIWNANHPSITSCDPQRGGFRIQYKLSDGFGVPVINETGSYMVVVSYGNQTMRLPFVVVQSTNDTTDLSTSLPNYTSSTISSSQPSKSVANSTANSPDFKVGPDLLGSLPHQLVFFMKSNSTAKIFVEYTSHEPNTGTMPSYSSVYVGKGGDYNSLTTSDVTINADPSSIPLTEGSDTIVVYNVTAKEGVKGVYWITLAQFCGVMPLVVDINSLTISPFDIPVQTGIMHCPAQFLDRKILGISEGTAEYKIGQPVK